MSSGWCWPGQWPGTWRTASWSTRTRLWSSPEVPRGAAGWTDVRTKGDRRRAKDQGRTGQEFGEAARVDDHAAAPRPREWHLARWWLTAAGTRLCDSAGRTL